MLGGVNEADFPYCSPAKSCRQDRKKTHATIVLACPPMFKPPWDNPSQTSQGKPSLFIPLPGEGQKGRRSYLKQTPVSNGRGAETWTPCLLKANPTPGAPYTHGWASPALSAGTRQVQKAGPTPDIPSQPQTVHRQRPGPPLWCSQESGENSIEEA